MKNHIKIEVIKCLIPTQFVRHTWIFQSSFIEFHQQCVDREFIGTFMNFRTQDFKTTNCVEMKCLITSILYSTNMDELSC